MTVWRMPPKRLARAAALSTLLSVAAVAGHAEEPRSESVPSALDHPDRKEQPAPTRVFTDKDGRSCRIYERHVVIDGGPTTAWATVCREASGRWVLSR